jgi:S1-C subfamily serine protease
MKAFKQLSVAMSLAAAVATSSHAAPEAEATARELVKRYADTIVGVELVVTLKVKMGGREQPANEQRIEVNGTVISPTGLTVTTLADVDPQATFEALRAGGGEPLRGGAEIVGSEFKEVKLRLADGREVPARFVLKDADLDLAFMAPETNEPGKEYPHVKLDQATDAALMGNFFYVARAPKTLQRVPLVRRSEVMGIVEKPRRFYLLTDQIPGTPVFDAAGKILGISLRNFANGRQAGVAVLPAADIADMGKQAEAARAKASAPAQP